MSICKYDVVHPFFKLEPLVGTVKALAKCWGVYLLNKKIDF